jgi:hypothetical protein
MFAVFDGLLVVESLKATNELTLNLKCAISITSRAFWLVLTHGPFQPYVQPNAYLSLSAKVKQKMEDLVLLCLVFFI